MPATTEDRRATDHQLERLAREMGEIIGKAQPEDREMLRQLATDLLRDQCTSAQASQISNTNGGKRPLNLVALGGFIVILGAGLSIVVPPIGLVLLVGGVATLVLGAIYRAVTK